MKDNPEDSNVKVLWAVANPLSQSKAVGADNKQYNGIGGHLFAIASEKSNDYGYGGFWTAPASNKELLQYYSEKLGGVPYSSTEPGYWFYIDENASRELLNKYNYEWSAK